MRSNFVVKQNFKRHTQCTCGNPLGKLGKLIGKFQRFFAFAQVVAKGKLRLDTVQVVSGKGNQTLGVLFKLVHVAVEESFFRNQTQVIAVRFAFYVKEATLGKSGVLDRKSVV